jgi:hypothetical protein
MITAWLSRLLGYRDVTRIERWHSSFGADWAHQTPALALFLALAVAGLAFWFYLRWQVRGHRSHRLILATVRAALLALLVVILADPILEVTLVSRPKPVLCLLFDGSDSMAIPDELTSEEAARLKSAVGWEKYAGQRPEIVSTSQPRGEFVRAALQKDDSQWLRQLADNFELKAFAFDDDQGVHSLAAAALADDIGPNCGAALAESWTTEGTVTAIGDALADLASGHGSETLAGVVMFSDFEQNSGSAAMASARKLGAPVFTIGVGPLSAVDLSVDLLAPPTMKKAEASTISVTVRQREFEQRSLEVRLFARPPVTSSDAEPQRIPIGTQTVSLAEGSASVEFPFTPEEAGRFVFEAEIDPIDGEVVVENNRAEREVNIIDDFLRLLYVEYEPTWEWRFIKEVFHRDKLVGARGFRTFLRSADPVVRETNELFLPSLTLPRSEFFQFDVIFLGDMPASALSTRFCEMTKEFVSQFGGGLVVLAGSRFGPGQLASTPLADLLPVIVDPHGRIRDQNEFRLNLTPVASQFDFMRLGHGEPTENLKAWHNLGKLPWYQPVLRPEPRSTTILAEHPSDTCADGKTKQPFIAVRKYGRGEVVYLGFNEMWRLRRLYGEEYYRQFWGQMIYRLGLSHALGSHKRFVVRTDKQRYRAGEQALVTVEAYDKDFQPLDETALPDGRLLAELLVPQRDGSDRLQPLAVPELRRGVFETRVPVTAAGEYRIRVTDPVDRETAEVNFEVSGLSLERRSAVRNVSLQRTLAAETGGKAYDLESMFQLPDDFRPPRREEQTVEVFPLWNTWLSFILLVGLMLSEWFGRKLVNLA